MKDQKIAQLMHSLTRIRGQIPEGMFPDWRIQMGETIAAELVMRNCQNQAHQHTTVQQVFRAHPELAKGEAHLFGFKVRVRVGMGESWEFVLASGGSDGR